MSEHAVDGGQQSVEIGQQLPAREFECGNVQLMLYNAALWNGHRIHFDEPYAKEVEGYPGLVVAGPLIGDWLHQCVEEWLGDSGRLVSIDYSNRAAAYVGDKLVFAGTVTDWQPDTSEAVVDVAINNEAGQAVAPGRIVVRFGDAW